MNVFLKTGLSNMLDDLLDDLEAEIEITPSQYAAAERSYNSVGEWLNRPGSHLAKYEPQVYVQGSFRLGTAIKPLGDDDEYDVDAVCELKKYTKRHGSQFKLKEQLGIDLKAYVIAYGMQNPVEERRRCWTLHYSDESQFHLDVVPAVPNSAQQLILMEQHHLPAKFVETALSITDNENPKYHAVSDDWPRSNPKGYGEWFKSRMAAVFERRRKIVALSERAEVENIPDYKVKTPLQSAIKLLKRHRDMMFASDMTDAPISIIITTLSAHAYQAEETTSSAIQRILSDMHLHILEKDGASLICNPSDPLENFADKWASFPERRIAFFEWLDRARIDFAAAASAFDRQAMAGKLAPSMGVALTQRALARGNSNALTGNALTLFSEVRDLVLKASHKRRPRWPQDLTGVVIIKEASFTRSGFRSIPLQSGSQSVERHGSLSFEAWTNVSAPYRVYWQVVNTGSDAEKARCLRGNFEYFERGGLTKTERTLYRGTHSIECFIVKNGTLVARSGAFIVSIR